MSTIRLLTKDCPRADCSISFGVAMSTCMGWTPTFDKNGNCTSRDPNAHYQDANCSRCGASWSIKEQYGETTISVLTAPTND